MSNDPIEASTTSETEPTANYSRWMTDLETEISHLKLYQLAIPGAHNSGVDKSGTWGPWEDWGACQINSFPQQLAAGARFLDLRLLDDSYKKTTGNHSPITRFYEVFQFNHGLAKAGRRLEHLIRDVKNFVTANPREIVILNFRHYDKNKWPDSLERCLPYFNPIKNLLIPKTAHDLTINDIRKLYPSRSIILAFDHGTPQTWKPEWVQREQLWSLIHYYWNLDDSEEAIEKLVVESMLSPPLEAYWVLSAAARDNRGPKLLPPHHPIRVETFSPGKQNGNIILVDFVEKNETIISVTDKCIALNKQRAANTLPPTTPKNLIVKKINEANFQNTLEFNWERGDDNIGIRKYEIFNGNDFLFSTYNIPHREKNFPLSNYSFKVRSVNTIDQKSDFSVPFILIQDVIPPTAPQNFRISKLGLTALELEWKASFDAAGIAGYEVSIDNQAPQFTSELKIIFSNLATSQQHYSKVRAKDVNGMFSEYTELVIQPPPTKLLNPKLDIREIEENSDTYTRYISWDLIEAPNRTISYEYKVDGFLYAGIHEEGKAPKRFLVGSVNRPTTIEAYIAFFAGERGETSTYNFTFNPTPPHILCRT